MDEEPVVWNTLVSAGAGLTRNCDPISMNDGSCQWSVGTVRRRSVKLDMSQSLCVCVCVCVCVSGCVSMCVWVCLRTVPSSHQKLIHERDLSWGSH